MINNRKRRIRCDNGIKKKRIKDKENYKRKDEVNNKKVKKRIRGINNEDG